MPVDEQRELTFIHIPKTAGTAFQAATGITHDARTHFAWRYWAPLGHPSFAVVREPVDRFLSALNYVLTVHWRWMARSRQPHRDHHLVRDMTVDEVIDAAARFVADHAAGARLDDPARLRGLVWYPQASFVCDGERVMVDRLFEFRTMEADINEWFRATGRAPFRMARANASRRYVEALSDHQARRIREIYATDVALHRAVGEGRY